MPNPWTADRLLARESEIALRRFPLTFTRVESKITLDEVFGMVLEDLQAQTSQQPVPEIMGILGVGKTGKTGIMESTRSLETFVTAERVEDPGRGGEVSTTILIMWRNRGGTTDDRSERLGGVPQAPPRRTDPPSRSDPPLPEAKATKGRGKQAKRGRK